MAVGGVGVGGREAHAQLLGLNVFALPWRGKREARAAGGRVDLDPAIAAAEGGVGALLKADPLVELDGAVLVARGDHHEAYCLNARRSSGHLGSSW